MIDRKPARLFPATHRPERSRPSMPGRSAQGPGNPGRCASSSQTETAGLSSPIT
jgi:hypothetical protein